MSVQQCSNIAKARAFKAMSCGEQRERKKKRKGKEKEMKKERNTAKKDGNETENVKYRRE